MVSGARKKTVCAGCSDERVDLVAARILGSYRRIQTIVGARPRRGIQNSAGYLVMLLAFIAGASMSNTIRGNTSRSSERKMAL